MNNDQMLLGAPALAKGTIRRVHAAHGRRVECVAGSLWITQDGDSRDVVLGPGEAFAFDRHGETLISALVDSRYLLLEAGENAIV